MAVARPPALAAGALLFMFLCLDISSVSLSREHGGLATATFANHEYQPTGASRVLLKQNRKKTDLPSCDEVADPKAVPGVDCRLPVNEAGDHDEDHDRDDLHQNEPREEGDENGDHDHDEDGDDEHGDDDEDDLVTENMLQHEKEHDHGEVAHDHTNHEHGEEFMEFLSFLGEEEPLGHAMELLGVAKGAVIGGDMVERLLAALSGEKEEADHAHGHDHGDGNDHKDEIAVRLTAEQLIDRYGTDEGLTEDGLDDACLAILACQVDERCALGKDEDTNEEEDKDDLTELKSIVSGVLFVEVLMGGVIPYLLRFLPGQEWYISLINTFSGGVILATGLVHLVPEVIEEQFEVDLPNEYPLGMVMMAAGFLLVFFLEHILFDGHSHEDPDKRTALDHYQSGITTVELRIMQSGKICTDKASGLDTRSSLGNDSGRTPVSIDKNTTGIAGFLLDHKNAVILLLALTAHGLLEGFVVGFQDDRHKLLILFASVASHKGAAAMALSSRFLKTGATFLQAFSFVFVFSLMGPLSIFLGTILNDVPSMLHLILNGLASGTFIYIGAYEVVHEEFSDGHKSKGSRLSGRSQHTIKFLSMVLGMVAISLLALIPHEHTD